jgi:hypothetical protein
MTSTTTTSQNLTTSTDEVVKMLRRALLEFEVGGATLGDADKLAGRLFQGTIPQNVQYPCGVLRLVNQTADGSTNGMRKVATLEVALFGRPWRQLALVEQCGDLAEQAMTQMKRTTDGLLFCRGSNRSTLPAPSAPADAETCAVRLTFSLVYWPTFLTRLITYLPPQ